MRPNKSEVMLLLPPSSLPAGDALIQYLNLRSSDKYMFISRDGVPDSLQGSERWKGSLPEDPGSGLSRPELERDVIFIRYQSPLSVTRICILTYPAAVSGLLLPEGALLSYGIFSPSWGSRGNEGWDRS